MTQGPPKDRTESPALIERRIRKIADARSITLALATTFVGLAFAGAVAIRFLDEDSFPSFGLAVWWALQTVTTVSFISFLTAGVTSAVIQRSQDKRHEEERVQEIQDLQRLIETLGEIRTAISALERRLS
jgi:membrane protein implicated in regulation of membrane protease activity